MNITIKQLKSTYLNHWTVGDSIVVVNFFQDKKKYLRQINIYGYFSNLHLHSLLRTQDKIQYMVLKSKH